MRVLNRAAQYELKLMLDNLSVKLKAIQKAQETPAHLDEYVRKLINVKHKVTVIFNVLTTSQVGVQMKAMYVCFFFNTISFYSINIKERLNRIYRQVENEKVRRKALLDSDTSMPSGSGTL